MENKAPVKTVISDDIEISGSIKCASNIQLDGKLNGDLTCVGNASIGETANIKGNISVESVCVMGQINGNITAKDKIELKATARVTGDIRSKRLTVEDGVMFVGKSEVNPSGAARGEAKASAHEGSSVDNTIVSESEEAARGKGGFFGKR